MYKRRLCRVDLKRVFYPLPLRQRGHIECGSHANPLSFSFFTASFALLLIITFMFSPPPFLLHHSMLLPIVLILSSLADKQISHHIATDSHYIHPDK